MKEILEKVRLLARDLRNGKEFPCSPRETLAGYGARRPERVEEHAKASASHSIRTPCSALMSWPN